MPLRARKPTGVVAWPLILVEGDEKAGKSVTALSLSASEKVGHTFVFDWGEGTADEYARLGRYEVVDHDGTFSDFIAQVELAVAEPMVDDKPNVVVIDSSTVLWNALKDWTTERAKRNNTNKKALAKDPDAVVTVPSNYWNDVNDRWGRLIRALRYSPVIAVMTARGKTVAKIENGSPVAGQYEHKIEAQKDLPNNASAIVRCEAPKVCRVTGAWSLGVEIPASGLLLPAEGALEHLIFEVLGAGSTFGVSSAVTPQFGRGAAEAKSQLVDLFTDAGWSEKDAQGAAREVWTSGPCPSATKGDEVSDDAWAALEDAARTAISAALDADEPGTAA